MLCSGLTNEIQCLIVITRKDLALRTKTNQRPSSKQIRMEVRLVTAASRGFFFLSRQDHDRGFAAHNRSFATEKNPLAPRVHGFEFNLELICTSEFFKKLKLLEQLRRVQFYLFEKVTIIIIIIIIIIKYKHEII